MLFLDDNKLINTGYADEMDNKEIYDVDFNDLAKYSDIDHYIYPFRITPGSHFEHDPRSYERHRIGKKTAFLTMSKGCVAKCTFCHRWDKGIRYIPVPIIIDRIKTLIEDYNVGFLAVGDENFGTDKKWLAELCSEIKKLDILWNVHGMRVNSVSNEKLQMMKDAGCVETVFGMETGSARMLKIMNKGVQLHHNYSALDYIAENELTTTVQLVLNMPGECEETIEETGEFIRYAVELNPESSPLDHSMNYAQALPGTPLYEFARHKGLIGQDLDAEEKYLLWISDKNAADENFTTFFNDLPRLQVLGWRFYLSAVALHAYRKKFGKARYIEHIKAKFTAGIDTDDTGYFNFPKEKWGKELNLNLKDNIRLLSLVIRNPGKIMFLMPGIFVRSKIFLRCFVLAVYTRKRGIKYSSGLLVENIKFLGSKILGSSRKGVFNYDYKSLRKIMKEDTNHYDTVDSTMLPLRLGRW